MTEVQDIPEVLSTSTVLRLTGLTRSALYFYIRQGLLPEPQRTQSGRLLFSRDQVEMLKQVVELRKQGLSVAEVRLRLEGHLLNSRASNADLAARERERLRAAIIDAATEEFMAKGYKRTHVSAIMQKVGVTPQVFYAFFPSKLQLLAECFRSFIEKGSVLIEPQMVQYQDPVERAVRRLATDRRGDELGSMLAAAVRSEGKLDPVDEGPVAEAMQSVMKRFASELAKERPPGAPETPVPDELVVYGLVGALSFQSMRVSWGGEYTFADFLRANLFIYLSVLAAIRGEIDIYGRLARYEELIQQVSAKASTDSAVETPGRTQSED